MLRTLAVFTLVLTSVACAAEEPALDPDATEETTQALASGIGGPCGVGNYTCQAGLVCGTDCSSGSNRCYQCYDPTPITCPAGFTLSNNVCVPTSGGGSGACKVKFAYAFYPNVVQTVALPLAQSDCALLNTSLDTVRPLDAAPDSGLAQLTTTYDHGDPVNTPYVVVRGVASAVSTEVANQVLAARDPFVAQSNISPIGFGYMLYLSSTYAP